MTAAAAAAAAAAAVVVVANCAAAFIIYAINKEFTYCCSFKVSILEFMCIHVVPVTCTCTCKAVVQNLLLTR